MAALKYWDNGWINVGGETEDEEYVLATGGTVEGPFPLVVDTGTTTLDDDIIVKGQAFAAGLMTTRQGSFDMDIELFPGRKVEFGWAEGKKAGVSLKPTSAATMDVVNYKVEVSETALLDLDATEWRSAGYNFPEPCARKNRESLVMMQGIVAATDMVTAGTSNNIISVLPEGFRPAHTVTFSTFCSVLSALYCRVNIYKNGMISYSEGPTLLSGYQVSLDAISFYAV